MQLIGGRGGSGTPAASGERGQSDSVEVRLLHVVHSRKPARIFAKIF